MDINDIQTISMNRNQPANGPDDPMDWDQNGVIDILDARGCVLACTLPRCAVSTTNTPPVADAGLDRTALLGDTIQLDGSGSTDVNGDQLTFLWSLASVPASSGAALSDPVAVNPSFAIDLAGSYVAV